jgi:hypothetical protein
MESRTSNQKLHPFDYSTSQMVTLYLKKLGVFLAVILANILLGVLFLVYRYSSLPIVVLVLAVAALIAFSIWLPARMMLHSGPAPDRSGEGERNHVGARPARREPSWHDTSRLNLYLRYSPGVVIATVVCVVMIMVVGGGWLVASNGIPDVLRYLPRPVLTPVPMPTMAPASPTAVQTSEVTSTPTPSVSSPTAPPSVTPSAVDGVIPTPEPVLSVTPSLASAPAPTLDPSPITTVTRVALTARDTTNIRGGPGTEYPVVGAMEPKQVLEINGRNASGDWWRVVYTGTLQAWVSGQIVDLSGPTESIAIVTDTVNYKAPAATLVMPTAMLTRTPTDWWSVTTTPVPSPTPNTAAIDAWLTRHDVTKFIQEDPDGSPGLVTFHYRWGGEPLPQSVHAVLTICKPDKPYPDGYAPADCNHLEVPANPWLQEAQTFTADCHTGLASAGYNAGPAVRVLADVACGSQSAFTWGLSIEVDYPTWHRAFITPAKKFTFAAGR